MNPANQSRFEGDSTTGSGALGVVFSIAAALAAVALPSTAAGPPEFVAEIFVDFRDPSHAGPGRHPTEESDNFRLTQGGLHWVAGGTVRYRVQGPLPVGGADQASADGFAPWDALNTARVFLWDDTTSQINPCTGTANRVLWTALDGPGDALAAASVCRSVSAKVIVGFEIFADVAENWTVGGAGGSFDVQNVISHEAGHVMGLGHVSGAANGCLAMYPFAGPGETQKRTPGLGDKLGMNALYGQPDTSPGPGCGA